MKMGELEAYRYGPLALGDGAGRLTLYVTPASAGVGTVGCLSRSAAPPDFGEECDAVAASAKLVSGEPFKLGRDAGYERKLDRTFNSLDAALKPRSAQLDRARTPARQAAAAQTISRAHRSSARSHWRDKEPGLRDGQPADQSGAAANERRLREPRCGRPRRRPFSLCVRARGRAVRAEAAASQPGRAGIAVAASRGRAESSSGSGGRGVGVWVCVGVWVGVCVGVCVWVGVMGAASVAVGVPAEADVGSGGSRRSAGTVARGTPGAFRALILWSSSVGAARGRQQARRPSR